MQNTENPSQNNQESQEFLIRGLKIEVRKENDYLIADSTEDGITYSMKFPIALSGKVAYVGSKNTQKPTEINEAMWQAVNFFMNPESRENE